MGAEAASLLKDFLPSDALQEGDPEGIVPFLKWAGGKRWLARRCASIFPDSYQRYFEPFFGGGAVFFSLAPPAGVLSDTNSSLIATYVAIRENWPRVLRCLERHHVSHSKPYYYDIRSQIPSDESEAAARFIYLNRTCWNGLYRVNRRGEFNVPIGTKTRVLMDDNFATIARVLSRVELRCIDFEKAISEAGSGDFVYVDPPYTVRHNNNGFLKYNEQIFTWDDQIRLCGAVKAAISRGVKVLVSNAAHDSIRELYEGVGEHIKLDRHSVIAGALKGRGIEQELLIKCY